MEKKTKNIILVALILVLSTMFVFGNIASGDGSPPSHTNSTTISQQIVVSGVANAIVENFSRGMTIYPNSSLLSSNSIYGTLTAMEANGSLSNYATVGKQIDIVAGNLSSYSIYHILSSDYGDIGVNATSQISLPRYITLDYNGRGVRLETENGTYTISTNTIYAIGSSVPVHILANAYTNGTIDRSGIVITPLG